MDDIKIKAKQEVLQKIMELMDEAELGSLKSKSPKFMRVETNDPEMAIDAVEKAIKPDHDDEMPQIDKLEEKQSDEMDSEELERLKELYEQLK
jgi:hypothetical protein